MFVWAQFCSVTVTACPLIPAGSLWWLPWLMTRIWSLLLNINQPNYLSSLPSLFTQSGLMRSSHFHTKRAFSRPNVFPEQGFPVFRRRWEGANKLSLCRIPVVKTSSPLLCFEFFFLVMPVRNHHWGVLTNDMSLSLTQRQLVPKSSVLKMSLLSYATGGCPTYVSGV